MARSPEDATQDINAQVEILRKDVATLTSLLSEVVTGKAASTAGAAQAELEQWLNKGRQAAGKARSSAEQATASIQESIEERPIAAVLIALAIGFVAGMISRR